MFSPDAFRVKSNVSFRHLYSASTKMPPLVEIGVVAAEDGAPAWLPAASAILGALVGGLASYLSNTALEKRRQRAEDARWRKENVYLPLREELANFMETASGDGHLVWGVSLDEPRNEGQARRGVSLLLWRRFTWELRAQSYATAEVQRRLDAVVGSAILLNEARTQCLPVLEGAGAAVFEEDDLGQHPRNWLGGHYVREVVRDEMTLNHLFGHPEAARTEARERFVSRFNAREDVKRARSKLLEAEGQLVRDVTDAITALEAAIKIVTKKFERPPKY